MHSLSGSGLLSSPLGGEKPTAIDSSHHKRLPPYPVHPTLTSPTHPYSFPNYDAEQALEVKVQGISGLNGPALELGMIMTWKVLSDRVSAPNRLNSIRVVDCSILFLTDYGR